MLPLKIFLKITWQCGVTSQKNLTLKGFTVLYCYFCKWYDVMQLQDCKIMLLNYKFCQCNVIWWGPSKQDSFWPCSTLWAINKVCIGWLLENRYLVGEIKFGWESLLGGWTKFWLMGGLPPGDSPLSPFHPVGKNLRNMGNYKKYNAELSKENLAMKTVS